MQYHLTPSILCKTITDYMGHTKEVPECVELEFYVTDCETEEQLKNVICDFRNTVDRHHIRHDCFGVGTFEDAKRYNDEKSFLYLSIPANATELQQRIQQIFKSWVKQCN